MIGDAAIPKKAGRASKNASSGCAEPVWRCPLSKRAMSLLWFPVLSILGMFENGIQE
jgi:hypothetical protein